MLIVTCLFASSVFVLPITATGSASRVDVYTLGELQNELSTAEIVLSCID
ncbi:hypothetical protein [Candidatus Bathycorpusculum sp.]|nr:hypothetical protein [Candidatus Termitimicrobium sp.]